MKNTIAVAGATGDLGERIVRALVDQGADVQVLVRARSKGAKISEIR